MVTQRSVSLLLACLIFPAIFQTAPVSAQLPASPPQTIAVGLLSARDAKAMAVVGAPGPGDRLSVSLIPLEGSPAHQVLSGDLFVALDQGGVAGGLPPGELGAGAASDNPFSVQAGSFGSAEAAEQLAVEVRGHWPETEVWVAEARLGDGRTAHRVIAGRFPDRTRGLAFASSLAAFGVDGAFVVETGRETMADGGGVPDGCPLILYNRSIGLVRGLRRVTISGVPSSSETGETMTPAFRLDGSPYRGVLEVSGGGAGIVAVNRVELEAYLLGVVPCELGPDRFPLLEALKAQAVAARTYALKHGGRHRSEGFDLCDTPHCQVYGGAGREMPLSSEAVRETAGLAAFHHGQLAETLYTSTCGGGTEISSAVFSGPAESYLGGVPCTTDHLAQALSIPAPSIRQEPKVTEAESGTDLGLALGLLTRLEILRPGEVSAADAAGTITLAEAEQWVGRIVSRHLQPGNPPSDGAGAASVRSPARCELAALICQALQWDQRLETLFSNADLLEIVGPEDECGDRQRRALAFLLTADIFRLLPDGRPAAGETESRGRFAAALGRLAAWLEPGLFDEGVIAGAGEGRLQLRFGSEVESREIAPEGLLLFERRGETTRPVPPGRFHPGDQVSVHSDRRGRVDLLVRRPAACGAAADRYSPHAFWSNVVDRETIEGLLEENGHRLGRLIDLQPLERGPGGRLTRLRVIGSAGQTVLRGLDIRWNLGTRENLFFIDRVKSDEGLIRGYRFTGRGWGHGVGLCQVGAAGMAESGATFIEILEHYFPGIRIEPAAGTPRRP